MEAQQNVAVRPRKWLYLVILVLLREENSYGYEVMERLQDEFGFEQIEAATVYRTLRRMENEGLCETERELLGGGHTRRMYSITEAGEELSRRLGRGV